MRLGPAPLCALLLLSLAGCGSTTPPPFALTCTVHRAAGLLVARVTVGNQTAAPGSAIVYGPGLRYLRFISPVLRPAEIVATVQGRRTTYLGYLIPRVTPKHPVRILMRFAPPPKPAPVLVTSSRRRAITATSPLTNADCILP